MLLLSAGFVSLFWCGNEGEEGVVFGLLAPQADEVRFLVMSCSSAVRGGRCRPVALFSQGIAAAFHQVDFGGTACPFCME